MVKELVIVVVFSSDMSPEVLGMMDGIAYWTDLLLAISNGFWITCTEVSCHVVGAHEFLAALTVDFSMSVHVPHLMIN